ISLTAFLVPYAFVFAPALLFQGSIQETLWYSLTALLGVYALAAGIIGYARRDNQVWENVVFLVSAVLLIVPEGFTDLVGFGLLVAMLIYQSRTRPKEERVAA